MTQTQLVAYGSNFGRPAVPEHMIDGRHIRDRKIMPNGTIGILVGAVKATEPYTLKCMLIQADNGKRKIHQISRRGWIFLYAYWSR